MSERQRESLSQKPVSLGGIVLSCAFLGDYGSLSVSLSSRPSVTQQHLTSREKTESVVKSNGLFPLLLLPRPNSQFVASPFPPRLRIKLQFCRQKSLKYGSSQGSSPSLQCRSHGSPCRLPKIVVWKWESICFQNELVLFSTDMI